MNARIASCLLLVVVSTGGYLVRAEEKQLVPAKQQFEALKKLVGDWVEQDNDGKPTDKVVCSYRVTSSGSALHETLFPGTDHEMVTLYHLDGDRLVLTHYCSMGNQPHLRAEPSTDASRILFKFVSATNLKSPSEHHMDEASFEIGSPDRLKAEWISRKDGQNCHDVKFDLVRRRK
jgi:hypothetical protein